MTAPVLLWLRQDLRLSDHPALHAAMQKGPVIPVYLWAPEEEAPWSPGAASRWWLHHSLTALAKSFEKRGSRLILRSGPTLPTLRALIQETGAAHVVWTRRYEPAVIARDQAIQDAMHAEGIQTQSVGGSLLLEPSEIQNLSGKPFQVFTPFWKKVLATLDPSDPLPAPAKIPAPDRWPDSQTLSEWTLESKIPWARRFPEVWTPGESGAQKNLSSFIEQALAAYPEDRNRPDRVGSSRLSPHLHWGEISPRQVWQAVHRQAARGRAAGLVSGAEVYLREIGWREFAYHLLVHFPRTPQSPLRPEFRNFIWEKNPEAMKRWQAGRTGYPIVDAGLRELWATGWMHNRVRMIVASFLVKDLLLSWQDGAAWFWDTLVDADLACNTLGWQWTAGCGADAAPYYRVFNPDLQAEKFDPDGAYRKKWVPDAASADYPAPLVDHGVARLRALAAFQSLKGQ